MAYNNKEKIHQCEMFDESVTIKCRKSLTVSFEKCDKKAQDLIVVVGLNPSKADDFCSDHTVTILKNYFQSRCRQMIIYNLFQNYSTEQCGIVEQTATDFSEPDIQKRLREADEIVIAWGVGTQYENSKMQAIKQLNNYKSKLRMFQNPNTKRGPCHPRNGLNHLIYANFSSDVTNNLI